MMEFEDHLRSALARKEPSPGFAREVLQRAARMERQKVRRWQPWLAGCVAASLLVGMIGLEQRREREQARDARAKVMQALSITSGKLRQIGKKVEGLNP